MPAKTGIALHSSRQTPNATVGARSRVMLLLGATAFESKSFRLPAAAELLSLCVATHAQERMRTAKPARRAEGRMPGVKRKITKEKGHPAWRLPPIHGRQVREPGPGFSTAHPCAGEKASASGNRSCVASTRASMPSPCRCPLRGLSTPTHRRTGAPGRAARHPGAHSVRNRCAVAKAGRCGQRERLQSARNGRSNVRSDPDVLHPPTPFTLSVGPQG